MKPTRSTSPSQQRLFSPRSPDYYPSQQPKRFRDQSLAALLFVLLAVLVALAIVVVRH